MFIFIQKRCRPMAGAGGGSSSRCDVIGVDMEASSSVSGESDESETSSPDEDGDTLLHLLAVSDSAALAYKLKSEKWRRLINAVNEDRRTPLHLAIKAQMIDAVEALLDGKGISVWQASGLHEVPFNSSLASEISNWRVNCHTYSRYTHEISNRGV